MYGNGKYCSEKCLKTFISNCYHTNLFPPYDEFDINKLSVNQINLFISNIKQDIWYDKLVNKWNEVKEERIKNNPR